MKMVAILGGGATGMGTAMLALKKGCGIFVSDVGVISDGHKKYLDEIGIAWEEQKHTLGRIKKADVVVKSPGIPDDVPVVLALLESGIPVISEIEFASGLTPSPIIAITGSNGKTTTSMLTHHLLGSGIASVGLVGNIGDSFAGALATNPSDQYVVEVSSFQLDGTVRFAPKIAVITNITPDHLDRYQNDFKLYVAAKFKIVQNQSPSDYFIYDLDDEVIQKGIARFKPKAQLLPFSLKTPLKQGACIADTHLEARFDTHCVRVPIADLQITGRHNLKNAMVAMLVAMVMGIDDAGITEGLKTFPLVPHRMERVALQEGVLYINDSKATNVDAAYFALEAVKTPIIWMAGGTDKGNDYHVLKELVKEKVTLLICLGVDNRPLLEAFDKEVPMVETQNMEAAVALARSKAKKGATVLLSPACASFDLFKNYEDRGEQFKKYINL